LGFFGAFGTTFPFGALAFGTTFPFGVLAFVAFPFGALLRFSLGVLTVPCGAEVTFAFLGILVALVSIGTADTFG
jgi:hypothetical protein